METKASIMIVDDETYVSEITMQRLKPFGIVTLAMPQNGKALFDELKYQQPGLILLDLGTPGMSTDEILDTLAQKYPTIQVMIFSTLNNPNLMQSFICWQVPAFINKSIIESPASLASAIFDIKQKGVYTKNPQPVKKQFTNREIEIVKLLVQGKTSKQIADILCISESAVNTHRANLLIKTNTSTPVNFALFILSNGLNHLRG